MKAIPRVLAGTAVVLAAVLTTAPLTAGIADFVLNPGQSPDKRPGTQALAEARSLDSARSADPARGSDSTRSSEQGSPLEGRTLIPARVSAPAAAEARDAVSAEARDMVSAEARIAALAADLQAGVDAGEFSAEDAARVLDDLSGYIRGERTWPERSIA